MMRMKAAAYKQYGEAAILSLTLEALPKIAAEVAAPLAKTDEIVLLSGTNGGFTGDVTRLVSQIPPAVHALTGVDLSKTIVIVFIPLAVVRAIVNTINTITYTFDVHLSVESMLRGLTVLNTRVVSTLTTLSTRSHRCIDLVHSLSHSHSQCHSHRLIRGLALHSNQFSQSFVAKSIANSVVSQSAARLNTSQDMPP
ncbi:unnamed protein product, partial [Oppiella nova]